MAPLVHANESQKWIERNRSERVSCHAVRLVRPACCGNDSNARRELPECMAKVRCSERRSSHIRSFSRYHTTTREAKKRQRRAPQAAVAVSNKYRYPSLRTVSPRKSCPYDVRHVNPSVGACPCFPSETLRFSWP